MKIFFDKLVVGPFRAYREPFELDFRKMGRGVWFVSGENRINDALGSNGAAKSTIWDCLVWTLYGKTIKGRPTTAVKPWASDLAPEGKLFVHIDGRDYVIHRKGVTNGLWLDDKNVVQDEIDRLIGMSREVFLYTIVHGQGRELFLDLKPAAKMEVLTETFNLKRWDGYITAARKAAANFDMQRERAQAEADTSKRTADDLAYKLKEHERKLREWDDEDAARDEKLRKEIKALEKEHEHNTKELGKADLAYDSAETELRAVQNEVHKLKEEMIDANHLAVKLGAEEKAATEKIAEVKRKSKLLKADAICPTCMQVMDHKHVVRELAKLNKQADNLMRDLIAAEKAVDEAKDAWSALDKRMQKKAGEERDFRTKSNKAIDDRTYYQSRANETKYKLEGLRKTVEAQQVNPYNALVQETRKQLKEHDGRAGDAEKKVESYARDRDLAKYWVEGFKTLRLYLIEDALAELESVTQSELASVGLDGWRVEFDIEKETKKGTSSGLSTYVYQPEYDAPLPWDDFSGGEGQRLQLVVSVALSKVLLGRAGITCDLLVLDEPTKHMSPEGIRDVAALLAGLGRDRQVCYVDHAAVDSRRFAGTIRVVRDEKGARLSVEAA